jgi:hypothetical protein
VLKRCFGRLTAVHVLLVVAVLEVAINRVAVPMLRPGQGAPPAWHTALDYLGLFLFYFAGTLAAFVLVTRALAALAERRGLRDTIAQALLVAAGVLAAIPLVIAMPASLVLVLEIVFAAAVIALVASVYGRERDLGIAVGLPIVAAPLLLHSLNAIGSECLWPESSYDGTGAEIARAGLMALCVAALITPYCFAPRPFAYAVTRPAPFIVSVVTAGAGALLAKSGYAVAARAATLALGIEMTHAQPDRWLAVYLLAVLTFAWTLASCAIAQSEARRGVGIGLVLILLGGYAFKWPHHYLLPLLGVAFIADAARRVRDEELAALPLTVEAPPIGDTIWSTYVGTVAQGLRRALAGVHTLTTRGEGGLASSVIVGDAGGIPVRARIERIDGCVLGLDVVLGREIDELRAATLTVWAIPARGLGPNPQGPPAAPPFPTEDSHFDERFRTRGSAAAFRALFDEGLRARAVATLDGWLAYWEREGLRYRVYPGRGAPLDHPMPLSDLALGRIPPTAERLVAVIELLVELAARGVDPAPKAEPVALEATGGEAVGAEAKDAEAAPAAPGAPAAGEEPA